MTGEQPIEVQLQDGLLSFDGRVVELFSADQYAGRIHINQVTQVSYDGGDEVVVTGDANLYLSLSIREGEEEKREQLEDLVNLIRTAAPNLEEGQ